MEKLEIESVQKVLEQAIAKRKTLIQAPYETAFRLLNGFLEDLPQVVIEIFGKTVVCHDYSPKGILGEQLVPLITEQLSWIQTGIVKKRRSKDPRQQAGKIVFGDSPDTTIIENNVRYAIDLTMNQDASFYLDTRELRTWLTKNMTNKRVLNTFAYTGSLGVAAWASGAKEVVQLDLNKRFLSVAKQSAKLNGFPCKDNMYQTADFWSRLNHFKAIKSYFDCVILDPPVYSKTSKATIDITKNYHKLINKVRPLIVDGGMLVTINNALFQSGESHYQVLEALCQDGYLKIEAIIPIPADCIGGSRLPKNRLPEDPAPYNHSTKITILSIKKK